MANETLSYFDERDWKRFKDFSEYSKDIAKEMLDSAALLFQAANDEDVNSVAEQIDIMVELGNEFKDYDDIVRDLKLKLDGPDVYEQYGVPTSVDYFADEYEDDE